MTKSKLRELESQCGTYANDCTGNDVLELIAEVRRLRAERDNFAAAFAEWQSERDEWCKTVDLARKEADELRACLRIAMEWCPNEGGFSTARDYERCRAALKEP